MNPQCTRPDINDRLLLFLDDCLDPDEHKLFAGHLSTCRTCAGDMQELRAMHHTMQHYYQCVPAELLVDYVCRNDSLSSVAAQAADLHLEACIDCRKLQKKLTILGKECPDPGALTAPAPEAPRFLDIVARHYTLSKSPGKSVAGFMEECWTRVKHFFAPLIPIAPQPIFVRNRLGGVRENIRVIHDDSGEIDTRIEIEPLADTGVEIMVFMTVAPDKTPLENARVSLYHAEEETVSLFVTKGKAVFKTIPHGAYELILSRDGREIKRITVSTRMM